MPIMYQWVGSICLLCINGSAEYAYYVSMGWQYMPIMYQWIGSICLLCINGLAVNAYYYFSFQTIELKPGGCQIPVTEDNKLEYLTLIAEYRLALSVKDEIGSFLKGKYLLYTSLQKPQDL